LIDHGIDIKQIDLGGMGAKQGRERIYHTISPSSEENESFRRMLAKGVDIFIQIMPQNDKVPMESLLDGKKAE
jgi:PTS system mannose-specific IIB component